MSFSFETVKPCEEGCDAKWQRGETLLDTVTWHIKPLVETARSKCDREIYKYTLVFKHYWDLNTFQRFQNFLFRIRVSPLQWNAMGESKRIPIRIFAVLLLISTSSFQLLQASDDDAVIIHLVLLVCFGFCFACVWWLDLRVYETVIDELSFLDGCHSDLLRVVWRGFWRTLDCVSERWIQW